MSLEQIEQELEKALADYERTEGNLKTVKKRLHRRGNKVLILQSKRRQLLKAQKKVAA